ncbi:MAG: BTAD domain-containing putative transcriptional regulator [Caldilineaceae bacterium]
MSTLQLAILGPLQIHRDHQAVELTIHKMQALLAYLALQRTPPPREQILALLWAESHPEAARKNLRNRLWQLRQLLGEEVVVTEGDRIGLAPTVWVDATTFATGLTVQLAQTTPAIAELASLLQLWRGPLLEGIQLTEAPDFELWLTTERARLEQSYWQGLEMLVADRQAAQDWRQVVAWAQRGLAYDPVRESLHQALMSAYAQLGDRTAALRQYEQLQSLLAQELGVPPLPATEALRTAIALNGVTDPSPLGTTVNPQSVAPLTNHQPPSPFNTPPVRTSLTTRHSPPTTSQPFIGRQAQFVALDRAWQQAAQGQCQVVLLSGELGMGKTRLWQSWAATLPSDQLTLETRCLNTTQALPFDPVRRLLMGAQARTHFGHITTALPSVWRNELLHLAPALQQGLAIPAEEASGTSATSPTEERALVAEALTHFFRSFQARPLIFFIDDLHWTDAATLDWLLYLTDRLATEPLLLVAAYRPEDAEPPVTRLIGQWQRDGMLERLPLPRFTKAEAHELLTRLARNVTLADYLYTQSGGNPYYLTQLSDVAVDGIPAPLADLVQARLSYLDATLQPVLQAAAILEPAIEMEILSYTSGRSEEETVDAVDELLTAAVLVERMDAYEFAHPLVASVVRDGLSQSRRKLLHRRAAEGLATHYADQLSTVAGQLAHHYAEAKELASAAHFAELAGAEALRIGAANEAVTFYRQAYELAPTPERQLGMGLARMWIPGQLATARQTMQAALATFEAAGDCQGAVRAGLRLAASYLGTGEGAQVLQWANRVLPDLELVDDAALHAGAHYLMGTAKYRNGYSLREADAHYAKAIELATQQAADSEVLLMSWFEWGNLYLEQGDYAQAVSKFKQAHHVAAAGKRIFFAVLTLNNLAYATLLTGDLAAATATLAEALTTAETYALTSTQQYLYSTQGEIALAAGELAGAEASFHQALTLAEKYDNPTFAANLRAHLGRVAWVRGALAEAVELLTAAKAAIPRDTAYYLQSQIDLWLAEVYLQLGEQHAAESALQLAQAGLADQQHHALYQKVTQLRTLMNN